MEEEYDVVVLGTGLTECIMSGLLSVEGKKVLHMDRNDYYGGESASLNLTQLYEKYKPGSTPRTDIGKDRDYNVDIVPKLMMASEELVNILVHTDVTRYLEFKQISGSYVFRTDRIAKVPSTQGEAVSSNLLGLFEKRRVYNFFAFVYNYDPQNPKTTQGVDLDKTTASEVFKKFGLEPGTIDFIGHAIALQPDNKFLEAPFRLTFDGILLYKSSIDRYGKSPYIYPLYGLGELPQGFARLSAIYGGTYMLDKKIDSLVYEDGKVVGVKSGDEIAKCKAVVCDPSYVPDLCKVTGKVIRSICLLKNPIPNTSDADSTQLIIPANQAKRHNDIYVCCVSSTHNVCPKGFWVAICSTMIETNNPEAELDLAYNLIGHVEEKFVSICDISEPISDGKDSNVFISKSYDASSHFLSVTNDINSLYKRFSGSDLVLKKRPTEEEAAQE